MLKKSSHQPLENSFWKFMSRYYISQTLRRARLNSICSFPHRFMALFLVLKYAQTAFTNQLRLGSSETGRGGGRPGVKTFIHGPLSRLEPRQGVCSARG